ncbi:MAG: L,D-transpeptidase [Gemmatimonadaceae bacterium]
MLDKLARVFRDNARLAAGTVGAALLVLAGSTALLATAVDTRYQRDINRIVFNRNWELLDDVTRQVGLASDSLEEAADTAQNPPAEQPYIVVSLADRRLWYKRGEETIFTTQVAVGSGKTLVKRGEREEWKFETPRGRLVIRNKEIEPVWVPPDWHYVEQARKKGLGVVQLQRGKALEVADGTQIVVQGNDVIRLSPDGQTMPFEAGEGREIVAGGNIVIPPFGTNQRRFEGVLGTHRLNLGDGYALHGTDKPETIGRAVSHGCVRLRNEDIAYLYGIVPVGTPVYIY